MANSTLNKQFKKAQKSSPELAAQVSNNPGSAKPFVAGIDNWSTTTATSSCVEKPRPAPDPGPRTVPDPPRTPPVPPPVETSDVIIPRDERERPGITSKTTSVGKKMVMIDHNSYYAYNPNSDFDSVVVSEGLDPLRFLMGRLWTQDPSPQYMGMSSSLFGTSVTFGHTIITKRDDWLTAGSRTFRPFKDSTYLRDLRSGRRLEQLEKSELDEHGFRNTTIISGVKDPKVRKRLKKFYEAIFKSVPEGDKPIFSDLAEHGEIKLELNRRDIKPQAIAGSSLSRQEVYRRLVFGGTRDLNSQVPPGHTFKLKLENSPIGATSGLFATISRQQISHGTYSDHSYEYSTPISSINLEQYSNISKPLYAKIDPEYNFYCKEYENLFLTSRDINIPEFTMPNIYTLMTEKYSSKLDHELPVSITNFLRLNPTRNRRAKDGTSSHDQIKDFLVDKLNQRGEKTGESSTGLSYFKKWGLTCKRMVAEGSFQMFAGSYSNYQIQSFPHQEDKLFSKIKDTKSSFPMLVDVEFSTDRTAKIADVIANAKLDVYLSQYLTEEKEYDDPLDMGRYDEVVASHKAPGRLGFVEAQQFIIKGSSLSNSQIVSRLYPNIVSQSSDLTSGRACYDFEEWLRGLESQDTTADSSMFFGESDSLELADNTRASSAEVLSLFRVYLAAKIRKMITEEGKFRSLAQLFNGKLCYNEALMYKIEKHSVDPATGQTTLVSQHMIPNRSETNATRFIDTQVKYDKPYIYRIKVVSLVIGNEYFYVFPGNSNQLYRDKTQLRRDFYNSNICYLNYCNFPSVKIIESPYYNDERDNVIITRVLDNPPVPPVPKVDVYKGRNDLALISLESGIGDFVDDPIMLRPDEDGPILEKIRENQFAEMSSLEINDMKEDDLKKVRFRNDDIIKTFEVYRTQQMPLSYQSFTGSLHRSLDTKGKYSSASFQDNIEPNTIYYYTFRSIDVHGYFSNPTPIYQVELVSSDGMTYPVMRVFNPGENVDYKEPVKVFNKFLEIKPLARHLELNLEKSGLNGEKNLVQSESSDSEKLQSVFQTRRSDFKEGDQFVLGTHQDRQLCWGRKFKIRITSKASGRKIDLNVRFDYNDLVKASDFYTNDE